MSDLIHEEGVVRFIKDGYAYLETVDSSGCGKCSSKSACSSASFFSSHVDPTLRVLNKDNLKAGEHVRIGMSPEKLLLGTLLVYMLPLFSLFLLAAIGKYLGGETMSIIMGGVGLAAGLLVAKRVIAKKGVARQFELNVERI